MVNDAAPAGINFDIEELRESEAVFHWMARILNEPIPVPGHNYVKELTVTIPAVFDLENGNSPAIRGFNEFLSLVSEAEQLEQLENLQQHLAVDRTRLFRGVAKSAPRAPYEEFYATETAGSLVFMAQFMKRAGVTAAPSNRERADYLGNELALAAHLCRQGWTAESEEYRSCAQALLRELLDKHIRLWAPRFCDAALPASNTAFFQAFLRAIREIIEVD